MLTHCYVFDSVVGSVLFTCAGAFAMLGASKVRSKPVTLCMVQVQKYCHETACASLKQRTLSLFGVITSLVSADAALGGEAVERPIHTAAATQPASAEGHFSWFCNTDSAAASAGEAPGGFGATGSAKE